MNAKGQSLGFQQFTVGAATASSVTAPTGTYVEAMLVRTENQNLRFRLDGTSPTSAVGYPIYSADTAGFWVWGAGNVANFKCISASSTATVDVIFFGLTES